MRTLKLFIWTIALLFIPYQHSLAKSIPLTPHRISLANGKTFDLNLPVDIEIKVAAEGLKRVRFMAKAPDDRIFVTDMYSLADNKRGAVYILDQFDQVAKRFKRVIPFMIGLRNPNSVAFYKDTRGIDWFYLALTDRLVRYVYEAGSTRPTGTPEVLATFPDYGLGYKYGGWHLTRTIAFGANSKLYVSVGSSCNACEEKEEVRATIIEMDPDGKNQRYFARGLRNAVGLRFVDGRLFATNMGADHLGLDRPADTMGEIADGTNYGWPFCFQVSGKVFIDSKFNPGGKKLDCRKLKPFPTSFAAHVAPLGLEYFDDRSPEPLRNSFLVALHGSTNKRIARGYRVVQVVNGETRDFITGFLQAGVVNGRPCDIFKLGPDSFLLTDDKSGVIYHVEKKSR